MRIGTWNIRGLGRPEKKRAARNFMRKEKLGMLMIQETKLKEYGVRLSRWLWGNDLVSYVLMESDGSADGLISCWRDDFFVLESKIVSERYVLLTGKLVGCGFNCGFGNVYAPNDDVQRRCFFDELRIDLRNLEVPWCLAGDFNVVKNAEEKIGLSLHQYAVEDFGNFIEGMGLIDLPLVGGNFTWCSNRSPPTFCRLDRFLVAPDFLENFPDIT